MAKKRRTPPTPKLPDKVEHYYRACNETTSDGLEAILAESRKTAKRAYNKHHLGTLDLWESEYGKRRRDAIRHTFPSIINHHGLTEKTKGFVTSAEVWSNLNQYTHHTLETLDEDDALLLAAALWFMDHADDTYELEQILSAADWREDWNLPYHYDLRFSEDMISAAVFILQNRTSSDRYILDVNPKRGETADAFDKLLALIPPDDLRRSIAHTRALFWSHVDQFYDIECALAEPLMKAVEKYDVSVDSYNENVKKLVDLLTKHANAAPQKPNNVLAKPQIPRFDQPSGYGLIQPLGSDIFPFDAPPFPAMPAPYDEGLQLATTLDRMGDGLDEMADAISEAHANMVMVCFDYARSGLVEADRYRTKGLPTIDTPTISDPFEICAGVLLLCSEDALRSLYANVPGATPDKDLDLPWLFGVMEGMLTDVAHHLPWGMGFYSEDDVPFKDGAKPLAHPDWYALSLEDKQSLAQVVYQATGAIFPRELNDFDGLKSHMGKLGIRGKNAVHMAELMTVLETVQFRHAFSSSGMPEETPADTEDVEELREQIKALQERLKKATDAAHSQDQRARKAEADLAAEREKMAAERAELAGLREVVFTADSRDDNHISVSLPYEVKRRSVIFGGHDMWQKPMKEYLTGDIRFIDRDMAAFDTDVIRYADVIWIQTNAIPHKMYYKIMDAVRKWKIPVKYFLYASARKCAEQIVLEERE
ncbi:MAG: hypothetical protein IJH09_12990 [Clostridia bacterium]|nr:hypothetical protein [Clostridia bacterium]